MCRLGFFSYHSFICSICDFINRISTSLCNWGKSVMKIKQEFDKLDFFQKSKLTVDFMRFIATMLAPFMIVGLQLIFKHLLGW
jgi:hypothetical protein